MQNNITTENEKNHLIELLNKKGISVKFDEKNRLVYLNNFSVRYLSKTAIVQDMTSLFLDHQYYFKSRNNKPLIFDVGSEVGTSVIFFKFLYPNARIISFEPHPLAYQIIKENVENNKLKDVEIINAAVAKDNGQAFIYGDAEYINGECNILGCSTIEAWGNQRSSCTKMPTKLVKLSEYINEPIDLLKLDVEGAEYDVFEELQQANKFKLIQNIIMEIHQWDGCSREGIIETLKNNDFISFLLEDMSIDMNCPEENRKWIQEHDIKLSILKASKCSENDIFFNKTENILL